MDRRPRSDIRMDGSVSEASTSLELKFTEENGCKIHMNLISLDYHQLLHTCNEKWGRKNGEGRNWGTSPKG